MKELDKYVGEGLVSGRREDSGQKMIDDAKCAMLIEDLVLDGCISLEGPSFSPYEDDDHIQALQGATRMEGGHVTIDLDRLDGMDEYEVDEMNIFISKSTPEFRVKGDSEAAITVQVESVMDRQMCKRVSDMFRDSYVNILRLSKGGSIAGLELNVHDSSDGMLIYGGYSSSYAKPLVVNSLKINGVQDKNIDIGDLAEPIKKLELDGNPDNFYIHIEYPQTLLDMLRIIGDVRQEGRAYTFTSGMVSWTSSTFVDDSAVESALSDLLIPKGMNMNGIGEYRIELSMRAAHVRINIDGASGSRKSVIDKVYLIKERGSNWMIQLR